jgi:hypothetical protein
MAIAVRLQLLCQMAECSLSELVEDACTNGFLCVAENPTLAFALQLQLLKTIAADESTLAELVEQACANNFLCAAENPKTSKAIELQLLCNISSE